MKWLESLDQFQSSQFTFFEVNQCAEMDTRPFFTTMRLEFGLDKITRNWALFYKMRVQGTQHILRAFDGLAGFFINEDKIRFCFVE
jgi:hypothetical protein